MKNQRDNNKISFICNSCHLNSLPFPEGFENLVDEIPVDFVMPEDFDPNRCFKDKKGLKIAHLNINSLKRKVEFVRNFFLDTKSDVFCLNESKIDDSTDYNQKQIIQHQGYYHQF